MSVGSKITLLTFLLIPFGTFSQSFTQHEPEKLYFLNLPQDYSKTDIQKQRIKSIIFYRDSVLSSSIEYDQSGNIVRTVGMENNSVKTTLIKYDTLNREIERKHFDTSGLFSYGYYFLYNNGAKAMYKIKDSLLLQENSSSDNHTIEIATRYTDNGDISFKHINHLDDKGSYLYESRYNGSKKYIDYKYERIDNKKYITKIWYDKKGEVFKEYKYLDEEAIPSENKVNHYTTDDQYIFRIDSLDSEGRLLKMTLINEEGSVNKIEESRYNSLGRFVSVIKKDFIRDVKVKYNYEYDKKSRLKQVLKTTIKYNLEPKESFEEQFNYNYVYY